MKFKILKNELGKCKIKVDPNEIEVSAQYVDEFRFDSEQEAYNWMKKLLKEHSWKEAGDYEI